MYLKQHDLPSWLLPNLYSSQPCESIFRQFRSFTSTYSTVVCCSVNEVLYRISKIQLQNEIVHSHAMNFVYPKSNHHQKVEKCVYELPTKHEIFNTIALCKIKAINTAKRFGFKIPSDSKLLSCKITAKCSSKESIKSKEGIKTNIKLKKPLLKVVDLKNVNLKNYNENHPDPDETSPFVQLNDKKVVRKTSLCWYLRSDYQKISIDRNKRVMALTENDYLIKRQNNVRNICTFKCVPVINANQSKKNKFSDKNRIHNKIKTKDR